MAEKVGKMLMEDGLYVNKRHLLLYMPRDWDYEMRHKFSDYINAFDSINLLDRDTGKEPLIKLGNSVYHCAYADGSGGFESKEYHDWVCPTCGWFVGELYSGHGLWHIQGETSYCARCGQKIDWTIPSDDEKRRYEERKAKEREEWEKKYGTKLDNMSEGKRRKYGMLNEVKK